MKWILIFWLIDPNPVPIVYGVYGRQVDCVSDARRFPIEYYRVGKAVCVQSTDS